MNDPKTNEPTDPRCSEGKPLQTMWIEWAGTQLPVVEVRKLPNGEYSVIELSHFDSPPKWAGTVSSLDLAAYLAGGVLETIVILTDLDHP